jgi:hypothetical protein
VCGRWSNAGGREWEWVEEYDLGLGFGLDGSLTKV